MQIGDVIKDADEVREENFQTTPPIDVYGIATNNGLEVIEKTFPEEQAAISGFITMQDGTGKLYVNLLDSPSRRRFTIAHEIGHWRLHKQELRGNPNRSILFRIAIGKLNTDPIEKAANIYAANLLVPLDLLEHYRDQVYDRDELAKLFGVSSEVMGYRLSLLEKTTNVQSPKQSAEEK